MGSLRIVTINTWKCDGDYYQRMPILASQLERLDVDIICCQECFKCASKNVDTLDFLAKILKMNSHYVSGRRKKRFFENEWIESESGLGILTKHEIVQISQIDLPDVPNDDMRSIQQLELKVSDSTFLKVSNVHLTHLESENNHRLKQIEFLAENINSSDPQMTHIVFGDFNLAPNSFEIKKFKEKSGMLDCFELKSSVEKRFSLVEPFERGEFICVDYIFMKNSSKASTFLSLEKAEIVFAEKDIDRNIYASDHFGMFTQFKWIE